MYAATRSLSQLTTSFVASQSQGIHHTPLIALKKLKINMTTDCDISVIDKNNTRYYNFSQYVKELCPFYQTTSFPRFANVWDLNPASACRITSSCQKNCFCCPASDRQRSSCRANVFERTPCVRGGECRSRTDDPLLAKQVL